MRFKEELTMPDFYVLGAWAGFGLLAGALAKILMPGKDNAGLITTCGLGIAGAVVGNYIYAYTTGEQEDHFNTINSFGFFLAVLGSLVLLALHRIFFGRSRSLL
jgi:uncharacterized membrane protein YeaQ/YmgE (transglycosylase-associated protein family)